LNNSNRAADELFECLSFLIVSGVLVGILYANVEQSGLRGGVFAQFGHFIYIAVNGLFLLSLGPAFSFFPLFLLTCLFLLSLCKS
jgi:hypothetical protein